MRRVWVRLGFIVEVMDEKFEEWKAQAYGNCNYPQDVELTEDEARAIAFAGKLDGESYIPAGQFEDVDE